MDFLGEPGDQQLWYNRGYANGMVLALLRLGQAGRSRRPRADEPGHARRAARDALGQGLSAR